MARYCRKCGTEVPDGYVACTKCGGQNLTNPGGATAGAPVNPNPTPPPGPVQTATMAPPPAAAPPNGYAAPPAQPQMDLGGYVAAQLQQGVPRDQIIRGLTTQGMDAASAMRFVTDVQNAMRNAPPPPGMYAQQAQPPRPARASGGGGMNGTAISGLVIMVIGIVWSVASFMAASSNPNGGVYVVKIGLVVFGFVRFLHGLGES